MPPVIFTYWPAKNDSAIAAGRTGEAIELNERVDYVLSFERPLSPRETRRVTDLGGRVIRQNLAILSFGNFVGRTELASIGIEVVSTKVGRAGVSKILEEVSELASSLVFGWRSPIGFEGVADRLRHAPVPYRGRPNSCGGLYLANGPDSGCRTG